MGASHATIVGCVVVAGMVTHRHGYEAGADEARRRAAIDMEWQRRVQDTLSQDNHAMFWELARLRVEPYAYRAKLASSHVACME